MPRTNTLAYYENPSITGKKSFITLAAGVNAMKRFFFVTDDETKQARAYALAELFQDGIMFARTLYWQRLDQPKKRSSLSGLVVSDAEKNVFFNTKQDFGLKANLRSHMKKGAHLRKVSQIESDKQVEIS